MQHPRRSLALSLILILLILLSAFSQAAANSAQFSAQISGAIQRDLTGAQIFYEDTPGGRQVYLQRMGPNDDLLVLTILLPATDTPGEYALSTGVPPTVTYFEVVGGVSREFASNTRGTLTISESGSRFSGQVNATIDGSGQTIAVVASFSAIPFNGDGSASAATGSTAAANTGALDLVFLFLILIVVNFGFQFYVGSIVYEGQGFSLLRTLRGTRTFALGWRNPDLRMVMIIWTLALIILAIVILLTLL